MPGRSMTSILMISLSLGFDESFNAITGLNGSGKSNILDAICFVLGITNMQSVSSITGLIVSGGD